MAIVTAGKVDGIPIIRMFVGLKKGSLDLARIAPKASARQGSAHYRTWRARGLIQLFGVKGARQLLGNPWSIVAVLLTALGAVADILSLEGRVPQFGFALAAGAMLVFGAMILFRWRGFSVCAVPFVVSIAAAGVLGAVSAAQSATDTRETGLIRGALLDDPYAKNLPTPCSRNKICIVVAPLADDDATATIEYPQTEHVIASLSALFESFGDMQSPVEIRLAPIRIGGELMGDRARNNQEAILRARAWLESQQADVLIHGRVVRADEILELRLIGSGGANRTRYNLTEKIYLPSDFTVDFGSVLAAEIARTVDQFLTSERYAVDVIEPIVARLAPLAEDLPDALPANVKGAVLISYADALSVIGEQGVRNQELDKAVAFYRRGLSQTSLEDWPYQWGNGHNNLGVALASLGDRRADSQLLEEAAAAFESAAAGYLKDSSPFGWALARNNQGDTYRMLGDLKRDTGLLRRAEASLKNAMIVFTREDEPAGWAMSQTNLGLVYRSLARQESKSENLAAAIAAYRNALEKTARETEPLSWAVIQNNLAEALLTQGELTGDKTVLTQALAAIDAALEEVSQTQFRQQWTSAQNNHGNILLTLGELDGDPSKLEEAARVHERLLTALNRTEAPLEWARIQNNLGNDLRIIAATESGTDKLRRAIAAFKAALEERTRERTPLDWAQSQSNLGAALSLLSRRESDPALREEALAAYQAALEVATRTTAPMQWARTQFNLASTLKSQVGDNEPNLEDVREAIRLYREVLEVARKETEPVIWAAVQRSLGSALREVAIRERDLTLYEASLAAIEASLEIRTRERFPELWTSTQLSLASTLFGLGELTGDVDRISGGVEAYRHFITGQSKDDDPLDWAQHHYLIGIFSLKVAAATDETAAWRYVEEAFRQARSDALRRHAPQEWLMATYYLANAAGIVAERSLDEERYREAASIAESVSLDAIRLIAPDQSDPRELEDQVAEFGNQACWYRAKAIEISGAARDFDLAEADCRRAIDLWKSDKSTGRWLQSSHSLAYLWMVTGEVRDDREMLQRSSEAFKALLADSSTAAFPEIQQEIERDAARAAAMLNN